VDLTLPCDITDFKLSRLEAILDPIIVRDLKLEKLLYSENNRHRKLSDILEEVVISGKVGNKSSVYGRLHDDNNDRSIISLSDISHIVSSINYTFNIDTEEIRIESININTLATAQGRTLDSIIEAGCKLIATPIILPTNIVIGFDVKTES
jgi:hypothetical protein